MKMRILHRCHWKAASRHIKSMNKIFHFLFVTCSGLNFLTRKAQEIIRLDDHLYSIKFNQ